MPPLPFIDDHARVVAASPERTWSALLAVVGGMLGRELPGPLVSAWGLERGGRTGDWGAPVPGDTIVGFEVAEVEPARLLVLRGRHRFSRYELRFVLEPVAGESPSGGRVELHAVSHAEFPGPLGLVYRTLVIGTRGHVFAVRRLLARIAQRAER
jgi:hypothetical protein